VDQSVRLWDATTGQALGQLTPSEHVNTSYGTSLALTAPALTFSPDGTTLAIGAGDGTVHLWDVTTSSYRSQIIKYHNEFGSPVGISSLAFSPDSKVLATGANDGTLRLWDPATGTARSAPVQDYAPGNHSLGVLQVAFSPDGQVLLASAADGTVRQYDPLTAQNRGIWIRIDEPSSLIGQTSEAVTIGLSPDGTWLAVGALVDGTVNLWPVPLLSDPYTTLCSEVGSLNDQKWTLYAPGEPEPPNCSVRDAAQLQTTRGSR
jgi:WD40 repeat protein